MFMVVLPFVIDDISYDLAISFKDIKKEEKVLKPEHRRVEAGSIEIGKTKLLLPIDDSYYSNVPKELTAKIRQEKMYQNIDYIKVIGTNDTNSDFYDVYTIPAPPDVANDAIDYLYGVLVNDLRLNKEKTKVLSLNVFFFLAFANNAVASRINKIKENSFNKEHFYTMLKENNLGSILAFVEFFNTLKIEAIEDSIRSYKDLEDLVSTFQTSNKKLKNNLVQYMRKSEENVNCFLALSNIKEKILDEPLFLPMFKKENNTPKVYYKDVL